MNFYKASQFLNAESFEQTGVWLIQSKEPLSVNAHENVWTIMQHYIQHNEQFVQLINLANQDFEFIDKNDYLEYADPFDLQLRLTEVPDVTLRIDGLQEITEAEYRLLELVCGWIVTI